MTTLTTALAPGSGTRRRYALPLGVAALGAVMLAATGIGWLDTADLVALPTTMFLAVYVVATAAGVRLLAGGTRVAAALSCGASAVVLAQSGPVAVAPALLVGVVVAVRWVPRSSERRRGRPGHRHHRPAWPARCREDDLPVGGGAAGRPAGLA